jgi:hypothetical protein
MGGRGVGVEAGQAVGVEVWGFRFTSPPPAGASAYAAVAVGPEFLVLAGEGGGTLRIPLYLVQVVRQGGSPPEAA